MSEEALHKIKVTSVTAAEDTQRLPNNCDDVAVAAVQQLNHYARGLIMVQK